MSAFCTAMVWELQFPQIEHLIPGVEVGKPELLRKGTFC
jgi:hypothetical protein